MIGVLDDHPGVKSVTHSAIGERIIMSGRGLDEYGRGVLVEIWRANAGRRYCHQEDGHLMPVDPNFGGWWLNNQRVG